MFLFHFCLRYKDQPWLVLKAIGDLYCELLIIMTFYFLIPMNDIVGIRKKNSANYVGNHINP